MKYDKEELKTCIFLILNSKAYHYYKYENIVHSHLLAAKKPTYRTWFPAKNTAVICQYKIRPDKRVEKVFNQKSWCRS